MVQLQAKPLTDTWVTATWEDYLRLVEDPAYAKAKGYYFNGQLRVETMGVGPDHASENTIIILAIGLFCGLKGIHMKGLTNCTYRKTGVREAQPDVSYYVDDAALQPLHERATLAPQGSSITNLDESPAPDLAIEVADSSLDADLGKKRLLYDKKRLLYEEMASAEYWVVDVENAQILAFQIVNNGSKRITQSHILPGLDIAVIAEAIALRRQMDDSQIVARLLSSFQA